MLRTRRSRVNASSVRNCRHSANVVLANDTRRAEHRWTHSKIPPLRAVPVRMTAPVAQMCFGYARSAAAIHLESRSPETRRRAAARERFQRRHVPAIPAISNDAVQEPRSPLKKSFLEKAAPMHHPAALRRSRFGCAPQSRLQTHDYTRGSSLAPHACAILPSRRPAPRQAQEHVRPIACRTKATEGPLSVSCCATTTKHKTSSRTDSQNHVPSPARERLSRITEVRVSFSGFDYRRPAQTSTIVTATEASDRFAAAKKQIGPRCTPKDFQAAGRVH